MKKIGVYINSLEVGGAEKVLVQIAKIISESKEVDLEIITMKETDNFLVDELKKSAKYSFILSNSELKNGVNLINSLKKTWRIRKKNKEFDVIVDFLDGDFYKYLKKTEKEKIVWLHSSYTSLLKRKRDISKKIGTYGKIITICEEMREELLGREKELDILKVVNIYNPFDFDEILQKSKIEFSIEELEDSKKKYFLTVCRLKEDEKDVETLLKAYSEYKGEEYLYIIGDGPDRKKLEELTASLNITKKVKFLGVKKNPYNWVKNAKVFILSSKLEGLPTVLIESLILKKKIISSSCKTGPKEILQNGEFGLLFESGNKEELLRKMQEINSFIFCEKLLEEHLKKFQKESIKKKLEVILNYEEDK
ncbi:MAG: glycosyltransferase [Cetobacterium sp.]